MQISHFGSKKGVADIFLPLLCQWVNSSTCQSDDFHKTKKFQPYRTPNGISVWLAIFCFDQSVKIR